MSEFKELNEVIRLIAEKYPFNEEKYPELKNANKKEVLKFAIRHSALHFSKTTGKISAISEDADHGEEINIDELKKQSAKSLINTLRIAELLNMSGEDLIKLIEEQYKE